MQRLAVWSIIVGTLWSRAGYADEVLTLTGDNPNIGFVDNVAPNQTWQILANSNGFRVRDLTLDPSGNVSPFIIDSGAPANSIRLFSSGVKQFVGNGSPGDFGFINLEPGVVDPDCGIKLVAPGGASWRLTSNNEGFTLEDFDDETVPFSMDDAAPTDTLVLASNGSVGIGTAFPNNTGGVTGTGKFFNVRADGASAATGVCNGVFQGTFGAQNHLVHLNGPVNQKIMRLQCSSGFFGLHVLNDTVTTKAVSDVISIKMANGNVGLRVQNPAHPLQLASGAHVTAGGVFTNASSRTVKNSIRPITTEQARETMRALQPVGYRYNEEPDEDYVGFIAEDVPELVATKDRKSLGPMDVVAVLTKVVQDQERTIARLEQSEAAHKQMMAQQTELLASMNERLAALEEKRQ